jgi:predicted ATPase
LFVERAAATMNEFELTDADAAIVPEICENWTEFCLRSSLQQPASTLNGIQGLADRLDDRMRLLTSGRRTALPRHHTMSAALDWSYGLLTEAEQKVFRRVAIFAGGFHFACRRHGDRRRDAPRKRDFRERDGSR